jgi:hypothetical protein
MESARRKGVRRGAKSPFSAFGSATRIAFAARTTNTVGRFLCTYIANMKCTRTKSARGLRASHRDNSFAIRWCRNEVLNSCNALAWRPINSAFPVHLCRTLRCGIGKDNYTVETCHPRRGNGDTGLEKTQVQIRGRVCHVRGHLFRASERSSEVEALCALTPCGQFAAPWAAAANAIWPLGCISRGAEDCLRLQFLVVSEL